MAKTKAATTPRKPKKIVDIAHPNISAPSETSKPIIVTNRSVMRDPMMTPLPAEPKPEPLTEPVTDSASADQAPAIVKRQKMVLPTLDTVITPQMPATNTPATLQPVPNFTLSESIPKTSIEDTPVAEPLTPAAAVAPAETNEDARRLKLDKLVETEQYFLPVDTVELRKVKQFVVLGVVLIIVLGLTWFNVALDANLIQIEGVEAPTNFFSN